MPAGTITALRAQANDPQRVNVFIDGEFALGVSLNTITQERLYIGRQLDEADYARIEQAERADKAFQAALRFLESRPRSAAEVRERLGRKSFEPREIDAAIARLGALGLIDDATFARFWVENRQACRPRGSSALREELRRKGIAPDVVASVLSDAALTGDEAGRARELARAALRKYAGAPDRATFARRLGGYLQRRGFSFEVIRPIIEQLWSELKGSRADQDQGEF